MVLTKITKFVKRNKPLLLTIATGVSFGLSLYFSSKATLKVNSICFNDELSKKQKQIKIFKAVSPLALSTALSYILLVLTYVENKKIQSSLIAACVGSERLLKTYRDSVKELNGEEQELDIYRKALLNSKEIKEEVSDVEVEDKGEWFLEPITGTMFKSTIEQVQSAEYENNRRFVGLGEVSFNDWLIELGLREIEEGEQFGWSTLCEQTWGYIWIDYHHKKEIVNGKEVTVIYYPFPPTYDYLDPDDETCGGVYGNVPAYKHGGNDES